ncbi:MAG: XdhC/CoxI family protein [Desulfurococcaceae archaeon]|jgi:xanthine dehydrogenase accessory factor|nr:XdhC/CoxI family protein [Desulfurococcaceae archaeon]
MSDVDVLNWVLGEISKGNRVALLTIIGKEGSGPRDIGALMAVSSTGSKYGTIGGGELENILVKEALSALSENKPRRVKLALRPENIPEDAIKTKMLCGGIVEVFINVISPKPRLILIGAGHVGKPLGDLASILGFRVVVIDRNPDLANSARYPYAESILVGEIADNLSKLEFTESDIAVIAYGEVETDYQALRHLVTRGFKGHIWALCSKRRAQWMLEKLKSEGISLEDYKGRLHMPAGLDIGSETPAEIAVSIVAEVICEMRKCHKPVKSLSLLST